MAVQISANTAEFGKGMNQATATLKRFESDVKSIGTTIGLTFGARELGNFILEANKLAGVFDGVKRAFDRLPQSAKLMDTLTQATHGTVGQLELMQQALRAKNFGISVKDLSTYLEFAAIRAQQTGESVDYMVNSIILGLGRGSIKILDNLQVNIAKIKETVKETGVSLQEAFRQQVLEQMQTIGGYAETSATAVDRLKVAFDKLKLAISQAASSPETINFFTNLTQAAEDAVVALFPKEGGVAGPLAFLDRLGKIANERRDMAQALKEAADIEKKENGTLQQKIDFIQQEINSRQELKGSYNDQITSGQARISVLKQEIAELQKRIPLLNAGFGPEAQKRIEADKESVRLKGLEIQNIEKQKPALEANYSVVEKTQALLKDRLKVLTDEQNGLGETGKRLGMIEKILQDIENEEAFKNAALDEKSIAASNRELVRLNAELDRLRKLGTQTDPVSVQKMLNPVSAGLGDNWAAIKQMVENIRSIPQVYSDVRKEIEKIDLSGLISSGISDIADAFGKAIGGSKNFGKEILKSLATFAQQFGGLLIATGIGEIALKKFNGPQMIAAGAALVAIGGAIKQVISSRPGSSGGSGGSDFSRQSANGTYQNYAFTTQVSGTNLNIIMGNQANRNNSTVPQWR